MAVPLEFPRIYLLKAHFEKDTEQLHRLEQEIGVVWNIHEAELVLGKVTQKVRARLELRRLNLPTEDVDEIREKKSQEYEDGSRKRKRMAGAHGGDKRGSVKLDSETEIEADAENHDSEDDEASLGHTIKVLRLSWYTDSLKAGKLLPIGKYLVYEGHILDTTQDGSKEHKTTLIPNKKARNDILARARADTPPSHVEGTFSKHRRRKSAEHSSQSNPSFSQPVSLLPETTEDQEYVANLPPIPDFLHTNYSCQRPTLLHCPNEEFLSQLRIIKKARMLKGFPLGRKLSYDRAVATIASYPYTLTSHFEVSRLPRCGSKIAQIWQQWNDTGHISEVDEIEADEWVKSLSIFYDIHGVADKTAREFYSRGWRDLDDVVEHGWNTITREQQIGTKFYDEIKMRIPRSEVEATAQVILDTSNRIHGGFQMVICGGYRRGKPDCGDIDVVLTHPDEEATDGFLRELVDVLEDEGHITHNLEIAFTNSKRGQNAVSWKGLGPKAGSGFDTLDHAFVLWQNPTWPTMEEDLEENPNAKNPNIHRRVDIIISPWKTAGCAVIGWSGGTMFERDLRSYTRAELGYKFDSSGVRSVADGTWIDLEGDETDLLEKEKKVFRALKLEWREPTERCTD